MDDQPVIRDAVAADASQVADIYRPAVVEEAISFEMVPPDAEEMRRRIEESTERWPWVVMLETDLIVGYAYARPFRAREAYQFSAETTIYVRKGYHRRGIGLGLMQHLLKRLTKLGHHIAIAGVTLPNRGSVALHERLGFKPVGIFPEVGRKFDQWHDVGFWSLPLQTNS